MRKTINFRLSLNAIATLESIQAKILQETKIKLAKGKILELIIFNAAKKNLQDLIN